jgi:hypothetical protein
VFALTINTNINWLKTWNVVFPEDVTLVQKHVGDKYLMLLMHGTNMKMDVVSLAETSTERQNIVRCHTLEELSRLRNEDLQYRVLLLFVKGKAVPLQAWSGPEGSRKLRFPNFLTTAQYGGKVVRLTHRPHLPPGNTPGTHFC